MDISLLYDAVSVANTATQGGLGFSNLPIRTSGSHLALAEESPPSVQISSAFLSPVVDAYAPPTRRAASSRTTATRTRLRKKRRTRRMSSGEDGGVFGGDQLFGGDGPFYNGGWGGGGGGGNWNFNNFGGHNWEDDSSSSSSSWSDPALDFVYEVMGWIALSSCVHFAFQRMIRIVADGIGDSERDKVPMRLTSVC